MMLRLWGKLAASFSTFQTFQVLRGNQSRKFPAPKYHNLQYFSIFYQSHLHKTCPKLVDPISIEQTCQVPWLPAHAIRTVWSYTNRHHLSIKQSNFNAGDMDRMHGNTGKNGSLAVPSESDPSELQSERRHVALICTRTLMTLTEITSSPLQSHKSIPSHGCFASFRLIY